MIMSDNDTIPKKSTSQINKAVFFTSALLIFLLVAFAAVFPDVADKILNYYSNKSSRMPAGSTSLLWP
ncbi:hypothetical protein K16_32145 [Klebsiella pneumoniae]|nr:hypothetical protein K16_32145 [Klebsiella pneumoniae]